MAVKRLFNFMLRMICGDAATSTIPGESGRSPKAEVFFSLRRDRTLSRSQDVFLNLAGRSLGKFFDEGDAVRRLAPAQSRSSLPLSTARARVAIRESRIGVASAVTSPSSVDDHGS